jgi:hypothetical protein
MTGVALPRALAGVALGLVVGLGVAAWRGSARSRPSAALVELVRAQDERLQALAQAQRRSAGALEEAHRQTQPPVAPAAEERGAAPASLASAPDPAAQAETARRLERGRAILSAALATGHWTEESRLQYREQLTALKDDKARGLLLEELSLAVNTDKLRVEGSGLF